MVVRCSHRLGGGTAVSTSYKSPSHLSRLTLEGDDASVVITPLFPAPFCGLAGASGLSHMEGSHHSGASRPSDRLASPRKRDAMELSMTGGGSQDGLNGVVQ